MKKGLFIVFEGIDGSGLTTNSKQITNWLNGLGIKAIYTKEPTMGKIGLLIREMLKDGADAYILTLLFTADRSEHIKKEILPKLEEGYLVICDRYMYSTWAYQSIHGVKDSFIISLNKKFPKPDLVILLDVDPSIALKRKEGGKEIYENLDFLEKVRKKFLEIASDEGFIVIPTNRSIEEVQADIRKVMEYFLEEVGVLDAKKEN